MNRLTRLLAASAALSVALLGLSPTAAAQNKKGTATAVLKFDTMNVSNEVKNRFYSVLKKQVEAHEEMHAIPEKQPSIDKILLAVGCNEPNAECLSGLRSYVSGDRIVFGSIKRSKDVYLFSLKMFDFAESRFIRKTSEQTVEGDAKTVKNAIPAVIEGFLHGDVGKLKVAVEGGQQPRIFFDGQKMGPAPTTLENLPLGQHAVTVRTADGQEKQKMVLLRKGEPTELSFDFGGAKAKAGGAAGGGSTAGSGSAPGSAFVPGLAVAGTGLAGIIVGAVGQSMRSTQKARANELLGEGGYVKSEGDVKKAKDAQSKYKTGTALTVIGYSVGAAGLAAGGYLIYKGLTASPEQQKTASRNDDERPPKLRGVRIAPARDGVSVGFSLGF
ncbi:MAG: hypothetical protein ABEL76_08805 [Bradymonadaceae bacterium]